MRPVKMFAMCLLSVFVCASTTYADGWHPVLPAKDDYAEFVIFAKSPHLVPDGIDGIDASWDPYSELMAAGRFEGVFLLTRAFHDAAPEKDYLCGDSFRFKNPVTLAYKARNFDLVKRLLAVDASLVDKPDYFLESDDADPLAVAVANDDLVWTKTFLDMGSNIKTSYVQHHRAGYGDSIFESNLLTISPSAAMDKLLNDRGLSNEVALDEPAQGDCDDSNVRFRSNASLDGKILATLNKGDAFSILGYTSKIYTIGEYKGRWVKVQFKDQTGWILQPFVHVASDDMP